MVVVAWASVAVSSISVLLTVAIVLSSPEASTQARALDFPLTKLGEGVIAMLAPIGFAGLGVLFGFWPAIKRCKPGTIAMCLGLLAGALSLTVLGKEGLGYLF